LRSTTSQSALLAEVHAHVGADAVTETLPRVPSDETAWVVGEIVNVQRGGGGGGGAAWVTVNVWPATAIVPLRAAPEFAVTLNVVVPEPVRELPSATAIQSAAETAVQAQVVADAVTVIDPEPPVLATLCVVGEMVNVHGAGGAACDTVNVCAPMVSVPVRAAPVFAAAVNVTVPLPVPDAPAVTVSHGAFAAAVHAQVFADAVTATEPGPPVSATF
jgi:hypothetical protein